MAVIRETTVPSHGGSENPRELFLVAVRDCTAALEGSLAAYYKNNFPFTLRSSSHTPNPFLRQAGAPGGSRDRLALAKWLFSLQCPCVQVFSTVASLLDPVEKC